MDAHVPLYTSIALLGLGIVVTAMLIELTISHANERRLAQLGAVFPPDEVYPTMQWAYPACFAVMALEGMGWGPAPGLSTWLGATLLVLAKGLKAWVIGTLGRRWTYRIVVRPGESLLPRGPYALMRHPNYVAVVGELVGMACLVGAVVTGPLATLFYVWLLRRRVIVEERAHSARPETA